MEGSGQFQPDDVFWIEVMKIRERLTAEAVVLALDGDMTMGDARPSHLAGRVRRLIQEGHERIVLDVGHLRFVDSAGLGELAQCCAAARTRGGSVALLNATRRLTDLLTVTQLLAAFDVIAT
jgi:anti-anti-sigma factor